MGIRGWGPRALLLVAGGAGCGIQVDFSDARFHCEVTADCPTGLACNAGYCGGPPMVAGGPDAAAGIGPGLSDHPSDGAPGTELLVFHPVADAYVDAAQPDLNRGESDELRVDGTPPVRSYIRFGPMELGDIDEQYRIESAALEIFAHSAHATGYQVAVAQQIAWEEESLTYGNAPPAGNQVGASGPIAADSWTSVDLAVALDDGDFESFVLTTGDETALSLASREAGELAPRLVLSVAVP